MKSVFYNMFINNIDSLQTLMIKYKYPNIQRRDIKIFCIDLLCLLGSRKEMNEEEKFLAGVLARASKSSELVFLHDNDDYIMQHSFAEFYINPICKYQNSMHIFDEEMSIQCVIEKQIAIGENLEKNFRFADSKSDVFIQLSDVVAGILGKLFKYINSTSVKQRRNDVEGLCRLQIDNILLIDKLRMKAAQENRGFVCSVAPLKSIKNLEDFFSNVKNRKGRCI